MSPGQGEPYASSEPPVHCPRCASRLMETVAMVTCGCEVIVARRCPECALEDSLVTSVLRAALWYRHDSRTIARLVHLADSLRNARTLAVIAPGGGDRSRA
jgi:hypothetical protein